MGLEDVIFVFHLSLIVTDWTIVPVLIFFFDEFSSTIYASLFFHGINLYMMKVMIVVVAVALRAETKNDLGLFLLSYLVSGLSL